MPNRRKIMIHHPKYKILGILSLLLPRVFLAMMCVLPSVIKADEFPPPGFKEMSSEVSPGENFMINFIYDAKKDRFLWDLSKINQNAFGLIKPQTETS